MTSFEGRIDGCQDSTSDSIYEGNIVVYSSNYRITSPKQPSIEHVSADTIFELGGPILFTAPHGISLWRGGDSVHTRKTHVREFWVTEIALKMSKHASIYFGVPSSFMVWDLRYAVSYSNSNLDPNFLLEKDFKESQWHKSLEQFRNYGSDVDIPLLHVDIHGKKDRNTDLALDIGFGAMLALSERQKSLAQELSRVLAGKFSTLFSETGIVKNNLPFSVNVNPSMSGWRGDDGVYTMSMQSSMMGIPSMQLEMPRTMRRKLFNDSQFLAAFTDCLLYAYKHVICSSQLKSREWYSNNCKTPDSDINVLLLETARHIPKKT